VAIVKSGSLEASLRRLDPKLRAILIYGSDESRIRELAAGAVRKVAGSIDDPFAVKRLLAGDLAKAPGRLLDEVQSLSMMGGRKVVWIGGADDQLVKTIEPVLSAERAGNLVIAEAENLSKSSALRQVFEGSEAAWIVPVYEPNPAEARDYVAKLVAGHGVQAEQAALALLVESYGTDLGLLRQEVEKLVTYCAGQPGIVLADVEAVCASGGELRFDDAVDAVFDGDVERAEQLALRLVESGEDLGQIAMACHRHAVRLQELQLAIGKGQAMEQAVRGARPAIFFKRVPRVLGQLRIWELAELLKVGATLGSIVAQTRMTPSLAEAIAMRGLLSLSQRGRALRSRLQ